MAQLMAEENSPQQLSHLSVSQRLARLIKMKEITHSKDPTKKNSIGSLKMICIYLYVSNQGDLTDDPLFNKELKSIIPTKYHGTPGAQEIYSELGDDIDNGLVFMIRPYAFYHRVRPIARELKAACRILENKSQKHDSGCQCNWKDELKSKIREELEAEISKFLMVTNQTAKLNQLLQKDKFDTAEDPATVLTTSEISMKKPNTMDSEPVFDPITHSFNSTAESILLPQTVPDQSIKPTRDIRIQSKLPTKDSSLKSGTNNTDPSLPKIVHTTDKHINYPKFSLTIEPKTEFDPAQTSSFAELIPFEIKIVGDDATYITSVLEKLLCPLPALNDLIRILYHYSKGITLQRLQLFLYKTAVFHQSRRRIKVDPSIFSFDNLGYKELVRFYIQGKTRTTEYYNQETQYISHILFGASNKKIRKTSLGFKLGDPQHNERIINDLKQHNSLSGIWFALQNPIIIKRLNSKLKTQLKVQEKLMETFN